MPELYSYLWRALHSTLCHDRYAPTAAHALITLWRHMPSQWSADLPEAFVILGYAFYVQPMLMPLLHEMPAGQLGVRLMTTAVRYVTLGMHSWLRRAVPSCTCRSSHLQ